jgi:hypothetical protein
MQRSQRFTLLREAMDMLTFTDAFVTLEVVYEERNGGNWDRLEIRRYGGHNFWDVVSMNTGATGVDSGEPSQVLHDLRNLIDRNHDITWICLSGPGQNGDLHRVVLFPGGERPLPQRELPRF